MAAGVGVARKWDAQPAERDLRHTVVTTRMDAGLQRAGRLRVAQVVTSPDLD
jgi:hypothetical protein